MLPFEKDPMKSIQINETFTKRETLLCKVPIQISGKNFVTFVLQEITHVNNAKCYEKEFTLDVK